MGFGICSAISIWRSNFEMYHLMADLTAATTFLTIVLIVNDDFLANFVAVCKFR